METTIRDYVKTSVRIDLGANHPPLVLNRAYVLEECTLEQMRERLKKNIMFLFGVNAEFEIVEVRKVDKQEYAKLFGLELKEEDIQKILVKGDK